MGLMDELRKLTHPYSDQEDDYDDYDDDEMMDDDGDEEAAAPAPRRSYGRRDSGYEAAPRSTAPSSYTPNTGAGRVVNLNSNTQLQVMLVKPERFDQASDVADYLRDRKAVVLNLEETNKDVARRLVDFLSGCTYALDGKIKKVAISTYLITPPYVEVTGALEEELESSGMYF